MIQAKITDKLLTRRYCTDVSIDQLNQLFIVYRAINCFAAKGWSASLDPAQDCLHFGLAELGTPRRHRSLFYRLVEYTRLGLLKVDEIKQTFTRKVRRPSTNVAFS